MEQYSIKNISEYTIQDFKKCFEENGSPKKEENIRWQFLENPVQKQYVDIAIDSNNQKTAAIYAIFPVQFKVNSTIIIGSQSLDTITDVDYRGKGLFIKLATSVYNKAINENIGLVYGFPNGNSIYGFKKRLEWEVLDPVPFLIKPLKTKYFTEKINILKFLPNININFSKYKKHVKYTIKEENYFPAEVDDVWDSFSKNIIVTVNRNKDYLDWRYINKPNEAYHIAHCYDQEDGNYLGFVVFAVKGKHGGKIAYIMELVYDTEHPKVASLLLKYAVSEIRKIGADCILSWCLEHSPNYPAFKKEFFLNMPEKFRPIELHFGARAFDDSIKTIVNKRENWYLSYSDSDTV